jgi:DNA polymerase-3 subunit delta'
MYFSDIVGQKDVVSSLKNALEKDRVGHAYIFSGSKGIGKRALARIFAKGLLCSDQISNGGCGSCVPCRLFDSGSNPDYREVESSDLSIGVDEIRSLQSDIAVKPFYSNRKVYVIIDADKMTVQAQNCLLKTLEEPPGYAVIILTTANYDALLETVRSRAVRYAFRRNTFAEVRSALTKQLGCDYKGIDFIASWADGAIGAAYELALSEEFSLKRDKVFDVLLKIRNLDASHVFELCSFFEANKNDINALLDLMVLFYRDVLMMKEVGNENILINSDKKDIILNVVPAFSKRQLVRNIDIIELARRNIKQNANFQLAVEVMLMKLQEDLN